MSSLVQRPFGALWPGDHPQNARPVFDLPPLLSVRQVISCTQVRACTSRSFKKKSPAAADGFHVVGAVGLWQVPRVGGCLANMGAAFRKFDSDAPPSRYSELKVEADWRRK